MPYHPGQLPKPCNADFYYFCKRKKVEINRDSSRVILSKISALSPSVIISWKAKRGGQGVGGEKEKKSRGSREVNLLRVFAGVLLLKKGIEKMTLVFPAWCSEITGMFLPAAENLICIIGRATFQNYQQLQLLV